MVVSQLHQGPLEPAAPWEPALIKYNGSVIVIGNHSKWAPGCGWKKSREMEEEEKEAREEERVGLQEKYLDIFTFKHRLCLTL